MESVLVFQIAASWSVVQMVAVAHVERALMASLARLCKPVRPRGTQRILVQDLWIRVRRQAQVEAAARVVPLKGKTTLGQSALRYFASLWRC